MARKNRTPEENARRAKIRELLQDSNISSMADIQNLFKETIAEFMKNGLEAELDEELGYSKYDYRSKETDNSQNGHSSKKLKTSFGDVEISTPRDRKGEFEPQLLRKNQTSVSQDIEEKILSMYAKGMTTSDIETHIRDIYGVEVSDTTISRITDKILPIVREWQQRPLESIYAVVFMDAIHYHVRSEGQIVRKAVYIAIGIDLERPQRRPGHVGWRKRERQVLGDGAQQPQKPRCKRYFHRLYRSSDRVFQCHQCGVSADGHPELYHPSAAQFEQVCVLQGFETAHGRSEGRICRVG